MTVCRILFCSPELRLLAVKTLRRFFLSPETACHGMAQHPCGYICICFRVLIKPAPLSCTLLSNLFLFTVTAFHRNSNRFLHFLQICCHHPIPSPCSPLENTAQLAEDSIVFNLRQLFYFREIQLLPLPPPTPTKQRSPQEFR